MDYNNLVRDFADRTLRNLVAIEKKIENDPSADVFEVTQLINSMLGLLVFPQQRYFDRIPATPLEELRANGWPIPVMTGSPPNATNLHDLMRCLRNGISHCNIEFTSDDHRLTGVRIWNSARRDLPKNWEVKMGLSELREIVRRFISLLSETDK